MNFSLYSLALPLCIFCILLLLTLLLYQQIYFQHTIKKQLSEITDKLKEIIATNSDEKIMIFNENPTLIALISQINCLLELHQKTKAGFRRSEQLSRQMLSNISHDIKTPMTVILGYLEIIQLSLKQSSFACSSCSEKNYLENMLGKVQGKAEKTLELINAFFTLAKLEAGDTPLPLSKINAYECCRESVLEFYDLLIEADFDVELKIPEGTAWVWGNQEALQRILSNLISNAIRYGSDGKYLGISAYSDQKHLCIRVTDKGKGIEPAFAQTIFERLFTIDDSRNRNIEGNGLGLTIAKTLAKQMGGDILLESEPYVQTSFILLLNPMFPKLKS